MSYFVYILQSLVNGDIYIGSTENINNRVSLHNSGRVKSTKGYKPWDIETHEYITRSEAVKQKDFLKQGNKRNFEK